MKVATYRKAWGADSSFKAWLYIAPDPTQLNWAKFRPFIDSCRVLDSHSHVPIVSSLLHSVSDDLRRRLCVRHRLTCDRVWLVQRRRKCQNDIRGDIRGDIRLPYVEWARRWTKNTNDYRIVLSFGRQADSLQTSFVAWLWL